MSGTKKILPAFLLLVFLTGTPYFLYLYYHAANQQVLDPVQAIPDRTALIIHINTPLELLTDLTSNNLIWKELLTYPGIRPVQEQIMRIDSMTRQHPEIRKVLKDHPLTITLSLVNRAAFDLLFLIAVPPRFEDEQLAGFFQSTYPGKVTILKSPYGQTVISRVHIENSNKVLYYAIWKGVCVFGFHDDLIKKALDHLSLNTPVTALAGFNAVASTTGKKVDANIYINFPYLSLALWKTINERHQSGLVRFARFADWSGLDLLIKKDEILLNGYTIASDSAMQTLALLTGQQAGTQTLIPLLPPSTRSSMVFYLTDLPGYLKKWERRLQYAAFSVERIDLFQALKEKIDTTYEDFLHPWIGNQIGRCWVQPSPRDPALFPVTILESSDPDSAIRCLHALNRLYRFQTDSLSTAGYPLFSFHAGEVVNTWLKPLLEPAPLNWVTVWNGFLLFAEDHKTLRHFILSQHQTELLYSEPFLPEAPGNLSDKANFSWVCLTRHLIDSLPAVLNEPWLSTILPLQDSLKKFEWFSVQLTAGEQMFTTSVSLRFNPETTKEGPLAWHATLDTLVSGTPAIVSSGMPNTFAILVSDTLNTLYKISRSGEIQWKQKLYGRVLSSFYPITPYPGDSLYYLFNTDNHLYLIRCDGKLAHRFPMKFPVKASNGLCLIEGGSASHPSFQVVIAFRNKQIYNFDLTGNLVRGWHSPDISAEITRPIQAISPSPSGNDKPLLFITGKNGRVLITNLQGEPIIRPTASFINSPHSGFYANASRHKGLFLTTSPKGDLLFLQSNGSHHRISLRPFSAGHAFFYEEITGDDGLPDFIFFDNSTLYYYDQELSLRYFYTFRHQVSPPQIIKQPDGTLFIGMVSPTTNEIFLFDKHGYVELESAVKGTTPFDIGSLEQENLLNLVIGAGKQVNAFRLIPF